VQADSVKFGLDAVKVQARTGPEDSRRLEKPDFKTGGT
jgi:hypothetical protein